MRRAIVALVAVLLAGCGGGGGATPTATAEPDLAARLQRTLDEGRRTYGPPAASAAVFVNGEEVWAGTSGHVSRAGEAVTARTLFNVGSVTKPFVAALVLGLAEQGVLRLDDPLARWLPDYPRARRITLRQLLNHTSGLADFVDNPDFRAAALRNAPELRTVEGVLSFTPPPLFEPGAGWSYSNAGYLLLGRVLERATGSTVGAELGRRLAAGDVLYLPERPVPARLAHAYLDVDGDGESEDVFPLARIRTGRPATVFGWTDGGIAATPRALARFGDALFRGRVLDRESLDDMLDFVESGSVDYGLGVERRREAGRVSWGHSGNNVGYRAELRHYPAAGVTIAVVWNDGRLQDDLLLQGLAEVVLE